MLTILEDYEGLRNLLNRGIKRDDLEFGNAFYTLDGPLFEHVGEFLDKNQTPVATGVINRGVDLIAIRNLSQQYDIAVPIARGGLKQGAIANLWGMPTRIVDVDAHNRKIPRGKWVNPISPEDFTGKNVLLFDKDAVTGASVRQTVKMLAPFKPESISIYFAHDVVPYGSMDFTNTAGLPAGIKIFYPQNAPLEKAGDAYIEAHEKLGTLYGRRRVIEDQYLKEVEKLKDQYPDLSESLKTFISEQLSAFDSLNPFLPGISNAREKILLKCSKIYKEHKEYLDHGLYDLPESIERFKLVLASGEPLPLDFDEILITARYKKQADEAAQKRNIENLHYPSDPLAAFNAAQRAVKKGFDIALIVGPEGFAYEPYFRDLGISTVEVNIPESNKSGPRTITSFDDLSVLQGKKVLVVEDDVRTGTTLQKLIEHIKPYAPTHLGLYLGQSGIFQKTESIPPDFIDTYIAAIDTSSTTASEDFREYLESRGLRIFKTIKP